MDQQPISWIPRPDYSNKVLQINVDGEFHKRIKEYCKQNDIKMSQFARFAMSRMMNSLQGS